MDNRLANDWGYFEFLIDEESLAGDKISSKEEPDGDMLAARVSRDDRLIRYLFNRKTRKMSWKTLAF